MDAAKEFAAARLSFNQSYRELAQMQPGGSQIPREDLETLFRGPPPLDPRLFVMMQKELDLRWELSVADEYAQDDLLDTIQRTLSYFVELEQANTEIRNALAKKREARPTPKPLLPLPATLPPPPSLSVLPPPPSTQLRPAFVTRLNPKNAEESGTESNLIAEVLKLEELVQRISSDFDNIEPQLRAYFNQRYLPVKYDARLWAPVRDFANKTIDGYFAVPANTEDQRRFRLLMQLLVQLDQVKLAYYQVRRVFQLTTVQEDEERAKAPRGGFLGIMENAPTSFVEVDDDN